MYRIGRIRQAVEFLLHLLQDVCGGAVLRFAVVDLVQDSIENLPRKNKTESVLKMSKFTINNKCKAQSTEIILQGVFNGLVLVLDCSLKLLKDR